MSRRLYFTVYDLVTADSGAVYVGGRVIGDLIRLEDCFTGSVSATTNVGDNIEGLSRSISMVVRGILLYGKYVNQVDPGMSAELELEPRLDARITVSEAIIGESDLPPFEEYTVLGSGNSHLDQN